MMNTMENNCCILNRERKSLKISVRSTLSSLEIKERLDKAGGLGDVIYIPGELTREPDGYSVYIRHKISIKEYLSETVPDTEFIVLLIEMLCELWQTCEKNKVSFYHMLFDYDAVFISGFMEQLEFVYLPGALGLHKRSNSIGDLLTIVQLHAESGSSDACKALIKDALAIITRWEEGQDGFPVTELKKLLSEMQPVNPIRYVVTKVRAILENHGPGRKWYRFLLTNIVVFVSAVCLLRFIRNLWVWPLWFVTAVVGELWAAPLETKKSCIKWSVLLSGASLPEKKEITVGRDKIWADLHIDDACVSRRHAVIFQQKRSVCVRDLFSANGTYVDGKRITAGEEVLVHSGQIIRFGERSQFSVKFRPRILFAYMVK